MSSSRLPAQTLHVGRILRDVRLTAPEGARSNTAARAASTLTPPKAEAPAPQETAASAEREQAAYERGLADGRKESRKDLGPAIELFRNAAQSMERARQEINRRFDEQVISLSLEIARKVLARELTDGESVRSVIVRALAQSPNRTAARVRLNPLDLEQLEQVRNDHHDLGQRLPEDLVLLPDPKITRGGCVVEGASGYVDARVETQIQLIEEALTAKDRQSEIHTGDAAKRP